MSLGRVIDGYSNMGNKMKNALKFRTGIKSGKRRVIIKKIVFVFFFRQRKFLNCH